jgi:3-oxoacyl-[acyl-carrier-protein] synthase III
MGASASASSTAIQPNMQKRPVGSEPASRSACGGPVPAVPVTLSGRFETSDEWIRRRTGIGQGYRSDGRSTGDLAVEAGRAALKSAGTDEVDLVGLATTVADHTCPATVPDVAARPGLEMIPAFDPAAVCGFVYALVTASAHVTAGLA